MISYRKEIDGLRALAVLGVIAAHLGVEQLKGGFVGVDVFFVISGFLITALLVREFETNRSVDFPAFFWRRVRRLVPAVLVTVILTLAISFLVFSQDRFESTAWSSVAALFSVSNIYFWSNVGYFDAEAISKPLLHTWSLGVEEQFYLFWPFVLVGLLRFQRAAVVIAAIAVLGIGSFILNAMFISGDLGTQLAGGRELLVSFKDGDATAFYWFPFRVFEFMIGAGIVFFRPSFMQVPPGIANVLVLLGVSVVIIYMVALPEDAVFPYYNALAVALATGLIIYAGQSSRLAQILLANNVARFIGRISYSVYLVHWPVIVFYSTLGGDLGSLEAKLALFLVTVLSGYLLFVLVENPVRKASFLTVKPLTFLAILQRGTLPISLGLVALVAIIAMDYEGRIPSERKTWTNKEWRDLEWESYCTDHIEGYPKEIFTCQNDRGAADTIVVWGDSHSRHLIAGLSEAFPRVNIAVAYLSACAPQSGFNGFVRDMGRKERTKQCVDRNRKFLSWPESWPTPVLTLISSAKRASPEEIADINALITSTLSSIGHSVYVLGDFIRPGTEFAQCRAVPDFILTDKILRRMCAPDIAMVSAELEYNSKLAELTPNYISVVDVQCPGGSCNFTSNGRALHFDSHHLSIDGSIVMLTDPRMREKFMKLDEDIKGLLSAKLDSDSAKIVPPRG